MQNLLNHPAVSRRRGSIVIEAMLVSPVLLLLGLGIVEFGQAMTVSQLLQDEARKTAGQVVERPAAHDAIEQEVRCRLTDSLEIPAEAVTVAIRDEAASFREPLLSSGSGQNGREVDVRLKVPFAYVSHFAGAFLHDTVLEGSCVVRKSRNSL